MFQIVFVSSLESGKRYQHIVQISEINVTMKQIETIFFLNMHALKQYPKLQ